MEIGEPKRKSLKLSLTPLIDMVFLLLVFFMLTTSFSNTQGIELNYSGNGNGSDDAQIKSFLLISVESDGVVLVGKEVSSVKDFAPIVKALLKHDGSQRLFIQTLGRPKVQDVVSVVDQLNILGVPNVTFMDNLGVKDSIMAWGQKDG